MSETLNHVLVSSRHEPYVLRSKSSRRRAEDITTIFRTNSYFRMCKEFYAPYFILFISNYLYLSLIISNYTSARALSYLCNVKKTHPIQSCEGGRAVQPTTWPHRQYIILRPRVAQECAPLTRHRWTFSPSSKDLVRPAGRVRGGSSNLLNY